MDKQSFDVTGVIDSMSSVAKQSNATQLIVDDKPMEADTSSVASMQGASCAATSDALPYKDDGDGAGVKRTCLDENKDSLQLKKQRMNDCSGQDENCGHNNDEDIASKESMIDGAPCQMAAKPEVPAEPKNMAWLLYLFELKIAYSELLRRELFSVARLRVVMRSLKLVQDLMQIGDNPIDAPAVPVQRPLVFYGDLYVENSEDENSEDENSEDENSDDENSDDENSEDENSDDENSGAENSEAENREDENSEDENSEDENSEAENSEDENSEDENNNNNAVPNNEEHVNDEQLELSEDEDDGYGSAAAFNDG